MIPLAVGTAGAVGVAAGRAFSAPTVRCGRRRMLGSIKGVAGALVGIVALAAGWISIWERARSRASAVSFPGPAVAGNWGSGARRAFRAPIAGTRAVMDLGRILLRLTIGGTFFVHGTQKLFGWFGGYGPEGTGQFFESLGLRPGKRNAVAAGATETGGGILIALGLATPLAAAGLSAVMITALRAAVWNEGIKPATGEHEVLLAAAAVALTETGPGAPSLDSALGLERSGLGWTLAALSAGAVGSAMAISMGQRQTGAPAPAAPAEAPATPEAPPAPEASTT